MIFNLPISLKFFSKLKIIYSLGSLCVLLFFVQLIVNHEENNSTSFPDLSEVEKEYRKRFNLMDGIAVIDTECTLDYINKQKLAQDHPCVLKLIRNMFLNPPSPRDKPYNFTEITPGFVTGERDGRDTERLLLKQKEGFFVECGAFDGYFLANTLDLELNQSWTGLLIEASPTNYQRLLSRNRKAWTSNVCLSLEPYPTKIDFTTSENPVLVSHSVFRIIETDIEGNKIYDHTSDKPFGITEMKTIKIQCFPFYSILLALNHTTIDYFSLDIEGHEKRVLETIPWERVDIKIMKIETAHIPPEKTNKTGSDALQEFLEGEAGYLNFKKLQYDEFYIKNSIN